MLTYRFNLLFKIPESEYDALTGRALRTARRASAVDTGRFRNGWSVRRSGDFLYVTNSVRYAAHVELGSAVHRRHRHKVLNALRSLGIGTPSVSLTGRSFTNNLSLEGNTTNRNTSSSTGSGVGKSTPSVPKSIISPQGIKSPALIRQRLGPNLNVVQNTRQQVLNTINNRSQFRKRSFLLPALAALAASQGNENNPNKIEEN